MDRVATLPLAFLLKAMIVTSMFLLMIRSSEAETGAPEAGLLCISECNTCPAICSPPPSPPLKSHPQPPAVSHYPPPSEFSPPPDMFYYDQSPPPPSPSRQTPPQQSHSPPQSPQKPPSSPWYPYFGIPPPPVPKINQVPPSNGQGPNNYPYPYYYFYASKAASFSLDRGAMLFLALIVSFVL